ncbi:MAG: hypothetical protein HQL97_06225 [Magnetococcales bacterium]|nr:hypothetical protein [Magnetococcales bacterium]
MVRLLGRQSLFPVVLAQDGERLRADTVQVIPSGKNGMVQGSTLTLHLQEPAATHLSTPSVNALFTSIASACQRKAIGVVLYRINATPDPTRTTNEPPKQVPTEAGLPQEPKLA